MPFNGSGSYVIVTLEQPGMVLDLDEATLHDGKSRIQIFNQNQAGNYYQQWLFEDAGGGTFKIRLNANSGKYLHRDYNDLIATHPQNIMSQLWIVESKGPNYYSITCVHGRTSLKAIRPPYPPNADMQHADVSAGEDYDPRNPAFHWNIE